MKQEEFIKTIKECKHSFAAAGTEGLGPGKRSGDGKYWKLGRIEKCNLGHEHHQYVGIEFHEPQKNLTIFQAGMLFQVYVEGKKPSDYAQYHQCIAGKEFIKNIKRIEVQR